MGRIVMFSGSNSSNSINQKLIEVIAPYTNHEAVVLSLIDFPAPIYSIDIELNEGFPKSMLELSEIMLSADAFIVSTPEHNGSMPAVLKNTIDWISRIQKKVFNNKPTLFLSASPGARGGVSALNHMLEIMPYRGADIVGSYSLGLFNDKYDNGKLDDLSESEIRDLIIKLEKEIG